MEEVEHFLDKISATFPFADEGHSATASFLTPLELSAEGPILLWKHKDTKWELALGTAGAFLIHVLAAAAVLCLPFLQPPPIVHEPFINVYFADLGGSGSSLGGAGSTEGAVVGKEPEPSPPEQKPAEKEPPPDIPKAKTEIQKAVTPAKRTKKDSTSVVAVHPRQIENRPADSRKIDSDTQDHPLENAPVSSGEGQRNGAGNGAAAGEGSAGPGRGLGNGSAGEFDAASVDRAPQILKKVDPVYPPTARSLGVSGKVVVRFLVGPDGSVSKPSIIEAQPKGYFEESTLEALRRWHFKPGNFKGKDVATWVILPVQFRLSGHN